MLFFIPFFKRIYEISSFYMHWKKLFFTVIIHNYSDIIRRLINNTLFTVYSTCIVKTINCKTLVTVCSTCAVQNIHCITLVTVCSTSTVQNIHCITLVTVCSTSTVKNIHCITLFTDMQYMHCINYKTFYSVQYTCTVKIYTI